LCCMSCPFPYPVVTLTVLAEGHKLMISSFVKSRTEGFVIGSSLLRAHTRRDNINMDITKMFWRSRLCRWASFVWRYIDRNTHRKQRRFCWDNPSLILVQTSCCSCAGFALHSYWKQWNGLHASRQLGLFVL
jgi:hypothetical protein